MRWDIWRLVIADPQVASLHEIKTYWTICDLLEANEALDIREEMHEEAAERAKQK